MPAGQTVFVSGTASIDADGATTHIGDASASGLFVGQILQLRLRVPLELVEGMTRDEGLFG